MKKIILSLLGIGVLYSAYRVITHKSFKIVSVNKDTKTVYYSYNGVENFFTHGQPAIGQGIGDWRIEAKSINNTVATKGVQITLSRKDQIKQQETIYF